MAVIIVENVPTYNGEHGLDLTVFTLGELARIYDICGLRPVHLQQALEEEDARLRVAFAVVAIERTGRRVEWLEPFWAAKPQDLLIDLTRGPGVPDPVPPVERPSTTESELGESEKRPSSGESGPPDGDTNPESDPSDTGSPGSETTAE